MNESTSESVGAITPLLDVRQLVVLRGERLVLDGITLSLSPGGAILLTGPNGAGKSTLLRTLAGLIRPDAGAILWNNEPVVDRAHFAQNLAYLGHQDALKPGLTLVENLALTARLSGASIPVALHALSLEGLGSLPARLLSAGQKRRTALARVLLADAPLWLLDEPSLGLDATSIIQLGDLIAKHRARGGMIIATTHVPLPLPNAESLTLNPVFQADPEDLIS